MTEQGVQVGPPLGSISMDPANYQIDSLPKREHMNFYNSFTIRQEFERHLGVWTQDADDYWTIPKPHPVWGGREYFQDPYRRAVFARSPNALRTAVAEIDKAMDRGIRDASVFFMTLGMAEVFINRHSGRVACQKPGYAGGAGEEETCSICLLRAELRKRRQNGRDDNQHQAGCEARYHRLPCRAWPHL